MWHIWIDTGGTFTDGLAQTPDGQLRRAKVLSNGRLRGQLIGGRVAAPWLTAPLFAGYQLYHLGTGQTGCVAALTADGRLTVDDPTNGPLPDGTIELFTGEEAPVLATRLLTQTPLDRPFPPLDMRLGTTKGTNALLERNGARVALVVTRGFRDLLTIGTQQRPNLFQLAIPPAEVLYESVVETAGRLSAGGAVLESMTDSDLTQLIDQLREARPDAIALSLLHAYRNPAPERQLREALHDAGFTTVICSTDLSTTPGYVARTQTTVVDAYLRPVLQTYLTNVQQQLGGWPVRVMTSAGSLVRADLFQPKDSLLSGPAGGVVGASAVAARLDRPGVLTLDMGGTSTDVARIDGLPDYRFTTRIGSFDLQLPSLAIETVAAGGGSICWFDSLGSSGQLRVGPHSAGASPGPACYGATPPDQSPRLTLTDINLLLGKLHPRQFGIPVFPEQAERALRIVLDQIRRQTGQPVDALTVLRGFEQIANETMAGAIRTISVARGFDPQPYPLLVFGGAGGLHGCAIARMLGMHTLLLPFDGGLLSAYGIGQAPIERAATRAVLQPLSAVRDQVGELVHALTGEATEALRQDIGPDTPIEQRSARAFLRLQGQEATVDVPADGPLEADFRSQYAQLYGHYPAGRSIELASLRVIVGTASKPPVVSGPPVSHRQAVPVFQTERYPAYDWTQLQEGDTVRGPALLLNTTSSAFIEPGWRVIVQASRDLVADYIADDDDVAADEHQNDVIELELFTQRFRAIADDMGAQLQRTAFSTNVRERLDFSCALLDADARLVANAPHIPVHLGSLGVCARLCLAALPLGPGDVLITNHPKYGGSHLPDVTLMQGVFTDPVPGSDPQLIGYVINRAHHAEIGGKVPGSMPPDATTLPEEGVVLAPQYVVRHGQLLWDGADGLARQFTGAAYPTRSLAENRADIEAALASLRAGETALRQLARQQGPDRVRHYMNQLQASATRAIETVLQPRVGQSFDATETLDDGHRIQVRLDVRAGNHLRIDFSGTSGVHPFNLNANLSILHSAVLYVLRLWVDTDIPLNEGLMAPVELVLPEASLLNPVFPADDAGGPAVVGGNTEVSQRLVDTLLKALGLAACSQGTMNNFLFGQSDSATPFGYYETIGGGAGATVGAPGRSAVHQHMTNTRLTDPEELERRYPVRLHRFAIRTGSGGAGHWRGGDGLIREIEFLEPVQATLLSQHRVVAPYGLHGAEAGAVGRQTLIGTDGRETALPGGFSRAMQAGERIRIETPGGGGANAQSTPDAFPRV
ncbi:hydantoinase B/oxoprolinase family protein [Spirosoma luteolum]